MNFKEFITKLQNLPDSKKKIVLWTIVAVLAVIMGVFWITGAISSISKISQVKLPEITLPEIPNLQPAQTPATPTANWQTYTNTEYGFEFKYPLSLSLKEGPATIDFASINLEGDSYGVYSFYVGDIASENINNIINPKVSDYTEILNGKIIIDNTNWNTIEELNIPQEGIGTAGSLLNVYTTKEKSAYILQCVSCSEDIFGVDGKNKKATFDQIISTFKFTK